MVGDFPSGGLACVRNMSILSVINTKTINSEDTKAETQRQTDTDRNALTVNLADGSIL